MAKTPTKRGPGRPPLPPEEKRSVTFQIKASAAEHATLTEGAERAGLDLATWLRELGLKAAARSQAKES